MSTRGGYGFVLNGKETIIYTGSGADLDGLGSQILEFLKTSEVENLNKQVLRLSKVEPKGAVTTEDIDRVQTDTGVQVYTRHHDNIETWNHLLYPGQNDPQYLLDAGFFIDGSWIIGSIDLEFFYMIDLDNNKLEIYHGYRRDTPDNARFAGQEVIDGRLPVLLASYSLDALPHSLSGLEEKLYE